MNNKMQNDFFEDDLYTMAHDEDSHIKCDEDFKLSDLLEDDRFSGHTLFLNVAGSVFKIKPDKVLSYAVYSVDVTFSDGSIFRAKKIYLNPSINMNVIDSAIDVNLDLR